MVFERKQVEVCNFRMPYRVSVLTVDRCRIVLGGETMEEVQEFKYLETVIDKHGEMDGEIRERVVKGRSVI